jgi:phosphatidylserine/phosphatidylglycerophosphate/cardiolipin synthase-like enzyme
MHNKYAIIDNEIVITGSFNWTSKAVSTNRENIVIIRDRKIAADFTHNFDLLWTIFLPMNDRLE